MGEGTWKEREEIVEWPLAIVYMIFACLVLLMGYAIGSRDGYRGGMHDCAEMLEWLMDNADKIEINQMFSDDDEKEY